MVAKPKNIYFTLVGLLHLARSLDYELANFHAIVMKAVDAGWPPHGSTQHFMMAVLDVNDQAPEFERSIYTAAVSENREPGEHVIRVTAIDRDSGTFPLPLSA